MTTTSLLDSVNIELPSTRGNDYNHEEYLEYLHNIHKRNTNIESRVGSYTHGATVGTFAYIGGVYSPTQNRIYFVPVEQASSTYWHYIDCTTGEVVAYAHGATAVNSAYGGGVYSPTQNRIYFVPSNQAAETYWHYINCNTGDVVAYLNNLYGTSTGTFSTDGAYSGGVYSPTQNRIYFAPSKQNAQTYWHYIDCTSTGTTVIAYQNNSGQSIVEYAYGGGVYSPTQNRIYFVPAAQGSQDYWHYIDCNTGDVVAYLNSDTVAQGQYSGGVYSPTQNRIYLLLGFFIEGVKWYYIDCNITSTGVSLIEYTNNSGQSGHTILPYSGGVYSPTQNRIYFVPYNQAPETFWHYIDCNTGNMIAYEAKVIAYHLAYGGGVYSPTQNRIYFVPSAQASQTTWHYIQEFSDEAVEVPTFMIGA
jgi:hypothetical protein